MFSPHRKLPYEHLLKSFLKKRCLNNSTKRLPGALRSLPQPRSSAIVIRTLFWWKLLGDGEQAGNRCVGKRLLKGGAGRRWNIWAMIGRLPLQTWHTVGSDNQCNQSCIETPTHVKKNKKNHIVLCQLTLKWLDNWTDTSVEWRVLSVKRRRLPSTVSSAISLSLSPTMLVPTQMYFPASLFLVLVIISLPLRICSGTGSTVNTFVSSFCVLGLLVAGIRLESTA